MLGGRLVIDRSERVHWLEVERQRRLQIAALLREVGVVRRLLVLFLKFGRLLIIIFFFLQVRTSLRHHLRHRSLLCCIFVVAVCLVVLQAKGL